MPSNIEYKPNDIVVAVPKGHELIVFWPGANGNWVAQRITPLVEVAKAC